ncbi:efflux RND transporter periplasmic adaptor subunit [Kineococcus sp. R8]|uniref:efflux RND transporter periplasmic adaptor subunit n=1 Tax=Kineococcus siccus TaxID=2696567 RepID=UPI00141293A8|nr:efflux RND transporter periplasmic adaptor subunit [Kineococcus siccus]
MRAEPVPVRPRALLGGLAAATLLLAGCSSDEAPTVRTAAVQRGDVTEVVEAPGTVQPRASSAVSAPASGTVATLLVGDGQEVQAGQVLMTIDSPQARATLEQAEQADRDAAASSSPAGGSTADARRLAASQATADREAQARFADAQAAAEALTDPAARAQALAAVQTSKTQYDLLTQQTRALLQQVQSGLGDLGGAVASLGQAQRLQTRAAVSAAQATVEALTVKAPISGRVSLAATGGGGGGAALPAGAEGLLQSSGITLPQGALSGAGGGAAPAAGAPVLAQGAAVASGSPLLTVIDASVLTVTADIDESDVLQVVPGVKADLSISAVQGSTYGATVTSVDPSASSAGGGAVTYTARMSFDGGTTTAGSPAPAPLPGMTAEVSLRVKEAPGVVEVPAAAVLRGQDGRRDAVWVVGTGGRAERRDITIGARGEDDVEVTEGLRTGETVVVQGVDDVTQGEQLP